MTDVNTPFLPAAVARARADLAMLRELDRADDLMMTAEDWNLRKKRTTAVWAAAFRAYGIDPGKTPPEVAAAVIKRSVIRDRVLLGLDLWILYGSDRGLQTDLRDVLAVVDPDPYRDLFRNAAVFFDLRFRQALLEDPDVARQPPRFVAVLGQVYQFGAADRERVVRPALDRTPNNVPLIHTMLGILEGGSPGRPEAHAQLLRWAQAAVSVRPGSKVAWRSLGRAHWDRGQFDDAARCYKRAVRLDPRDYNSWAQLSAVLLRRHDPEAALEAADRALAIELGVFDRLAAEVVYEAEAIRNAAAALAVLDVSAALALLARTEGYARPTVDRSLAFDIVAGRHPVVEQAHRRLAAEPFVANDCDLSPAHGDRHGAIWLLTGPNMGGKSTFLRQNALIAILAQAGSFVPAKRAHIGVVDRLFSRVGASDDLARGRSTFMVEMVETAAILNQAGERSLVILDEIGRGTATFDGLSIAWAAMEYLHEKNCCRAIFATHFHEMTALASKLSRLANVTMRVKEWEGEVIFLHEVAKGAADRSYGVQVARLAGLPDAVVQRAKDVLHQLETGETSGKAARLVDDLPLFSIAAKREAAKPDALIKALTELNPDDLTPREALEAVYRLKGLASR